MNYYGLDDAIKEDSPQVVDGHNDHFKGLPVYSTVEWGSLYVISVTTGPHIFSRIPLLMAGFYGFEGGSNGFSGLETKSL